MKGVKFIDSLKFRPLWSHDINKYSADRHPPGQIADQTEQMKKGGAALLKSVTTLQYQKQHFHFAHWIYLQ